MEHVNDYIVTSQRTPNQWWLYRFPNGREASVIPDLHQPLRFEIETDTVAEIGGVISGLSTAEAEDILAQIAALPAVEVA